MRERISLVAGALSLALLPSGAGAAQRTFVKSTGSDGNPCSVALPCRNFGAAITAVAAGGEVVVLDSGGYGAFTVTKAVTVVAPEGIYAGITATSGTAITVSAGASDVVVLRGLTLKGLGGDDGISFDSGAALHIENSVISGFNFDGIKTSHGEVYVKDTIVRDCGDAGVAANGAAKVAIDGSRFERNGSFGFCGGVCAWDGGKITVRDSEATGNTSGFHAWALNFGTPEIDLRGVMAANNGNGVHCEVILGSGAVVRVADSLVTDNNGGLVANDPACTFESLGNNLVRGNTSIDTSGTITVVPGI